jgi:hypothetical protein
MTDARKHIYSPFKELTNYAFIVRYAAFPMIVTFGIVDVESPPGATNCFKTLVRHI